LKPLKFSHILYFLSAALLLAVWTSVAGSSVAEPLFPLPLEVDTPVKLPYPFKDESYDPTLQEPKSPLRGRSPSNVTPSVEYDPKTNEYNFDQKMGKLNYRSPSYMDFSEYTEYDLEKSIGNYWKQLYNNSNPPKNEEKPLVPKINVNSEAFDRIFGGNSVDIRPQGNAELIFGVNTNKTDNPAIPTKLRKQSNFSIKKYS
jgi:hypothetical protein